MVIFSFIDRYDQTKAYDDHLLIVLFKTCSDTEVVIYRKKERRMVNDKLLYLVFSYLCNAVETHHLSIQIARTWSHLFLFLLIY
jgi:hypothetical protein